MARVLKRSRESSAKPLVTARDLGWFSRSPAKSLATAFAFCYAPSPPAVAGRVGAPRGSYYFCWFFEDWLSSQAWSQGKSRLLEPHFSFFLNYDQVPLNELLLLILLPISFLYPRYSLSNLAQNWVCSSWTCSHRFIAGKSSLSPLYRCEHRKIITVVCKCTQRAAIWHCWI